jgi:hypothetical protein
MHPQQNVGLVLGAQERGIHTGDVLQRRLDDVGAGDERMRGHGLDTQRAPPAIDVHAWLSHMSMAACPSEAGDHPHSVLARPEPQLSISLHGDRLTGTSGGVTQSLTRAK